MQLSVTFRQMDPSEALKDFAADKVTRIDKYIHTPSDAHVVLSTEKHLHKADITLKAHGMRMRGEGTSEDMYASIDQAVRNIEKQVKKYRKKLTSHKAREGKDLKIKLNILAAEQNMVPPDPNMSWEAEALAPKVTSSKELEIQTFSVDEAVMQMDLLNNAFFVFLNADTHKINILYRQDDALTYGLIETV